MCNFAKYCQVASQCRLPIYMPMTVCGRSCVNPWFSIIISQVPHEVGPSMMFDERTDE